MNWFCVDVPIPKEHTATSITFYSKADAWRIFNNTNNNTGQSYSNLEYYLSSLLYCRMEFVFIPLWFPDNMYNFTYTVSNVNDIRDINDDYRLNLAHRPVFIENNVLVNALFFGSLWSFTGVVDINDDYELKRFPYFLSSKPAELDIIQHNVAYFI